MNIPIIIEVIPSLFFASILAPFDNNSFTISSCPSPHALNEVKRDLEGKNYIKLPFISEL